MKCGVAAVLFAVGVFATPVVSADLLNKTSDISATPTVSVTAPPPTAEGNGGTKSFVFTVTLSAASAVPVTVNYATSDGTGTTADSDYAAISGVLTFPAGVTSQALMVLVNGDTKFETNETFAVNLSSPTNATIGTGTAVATITNDDATPVVSISNVSQSEGNGGTTAFTFTTSLSNASSQTVTVNYGTADGSATTADGDYSGASGTLTFSPGATSQTITIFVNGDTKYESNETFTVTLASPTNATISGVSGTGTGTINNDDSAPAVSIANAAQAEGNAGTTAFTFTVSLSGASGLTAVVNYSTSDGTATLADGDYTGATGSLSFAPGQTSRTITVSVNGDTKFENNETFAVNLSSPTNATIGTGTATGTIQNDDAIPVLSISNVTQAEGNSGTTAFTFTVSMSNASAFTASVNYATADGSATMADGDYNAASGSLTLAPGQTSQTITILVNGDTKFENSETFAVTLSGPANATISGAAGSGTGTIANDDSSPVFSIAGVSQAEGNSGTTAFTFTVSQSNASSFITSVSYTTADGTASTADGDYAGASGTLTFFAGQTSKTVTILVNGDTKFETNETFNVNLSGASNATIGTGSAAGTIINDDSTPVVSIASVSLAEGSPANITAFMFTVSLSNASAQTVTVSYATADGTATAADGDYTPASGTLTFTPGMTSQTIAVAVKGDARLETDETFAVNLASPTNASLGTASATGTILNDDSVPFVSIANVSQAEGNSGTTAFVFTVSLSSSSAFTATVNYATGNASATTADGDYNAASGTLTFPPGTTSQTITILVNGDTQFESDETFTVNLSSPVNATIGTGTGVGTILNDDSSCNFSLSPTSISAPSGGMSGSFNVTALSGCPWTAVSDSAWLTTVSAGSGNGSVAYTIDPNTSTLPRTATITVASEVFTVTQSGVLPSSLVATGNGTSVTVTWNSSGADHFEVWRNDGTGFALAGSPPASPFTDSAVSANHAYVYKVRAVDSDGNQSVFSNSDLATLVSFDDDPLVDGVTIIKAVHFTQLRDAVNAVRTAAGLAAFAFSDPTLSGVQIKYVHLAQLQMALDEARSSLGLAPMSYSSASSGSAVSASHVMELRAGVK